MSDLVRRADVEKAIQSLHIGDVRFFEKLREKINAIPSAEQAERTARAIPLELDHDITFGAVTFHKGTNVLCRCSSCGGYVRPKDVYCTLCGCKLEWNEG